MRRPERVRRLALGLALALLAPDGSEGADEELGEMGLEDLMAVEVTSVSKKAEAVADSPAAVYVITSEDIRRSGATSIPEALRLAPGVQVARVSSNKWAITSRGFNDEFANKLLVLIDGRSVYTPLFSGVWWDVQDVLLEDVDRIEVIRGPGATLWGANAVNGVINVITKDAGETQGAYAKAGAGTEENRFGALRWGGRFADEGHYRVYAKHFDRDAYDLPGGREADDHWDMARGGFRADWGPTESDSLTLQGDYYRGEVGERHTRIDSVVPRRVTPAAEQDVPVEGWNVLGRWSHTFEGGSRAELQAYVDRSERGIETFDQNRTTADVDLHHRFSPRDGHSTVWGLGYRVTDDRLEGSRTIFFDDEERTDHYFSGFLQHEWELVARRLSLSLGSKLGHNDYTGWEYQPSGRLLWTPHEEHTAWASVSRAVRTPSRIEHDARIPNLLASFAGFTVDARVVGNEDYDSETLMAYEAGYRFTPEPALSVDLATFFNVYDDLRNARVGPMRGSASSGLFVFPNLLTNDGEARSYGGEIAAHWDVTDAWRLAGSYSLLEMNVDDAITLEGDNPRQQASLRSYLDLPAELELDVLLWWVGELRQQDLASYLRVDVRIGWEPIEGLRLSLVGQNLSERRHAEFADALFWSTTEVPRGFYGQVEYRFR